MKKIYALAAVACMALAANAQNGAPLYITGQSAGADKGGFTADWYVGEGSADGVTQLEYADGVYKIHVNGLSSFTISTACGSWDEWQAEGVCYTCEYGDEPGVAKELTFGKANILTPWQGDYDVVVSGDLKTITLTTTTPQPPVRVFLRGDMNGWLNDGATDTEVGDSWLLTPSYENQIFHFVCGDDQVIAAGETFKIADAGWAKYNYGSDGEAILFDVETDVFFNAQSNITLEAEWSGALWAIFTKDFNQVLFSEDKEVACPEAWLELVNVGVAGIEAEDNAAAVYYNMQGVRVANPENGLYIVVKGDKATKVLVK